jgi:hypothetical protein
VSQNSVVPQAIAVHAAKLAGRRGRRRATAPLVGSRFLATWREGGPQEKSGGMLIIRPLIDPRPQRGLRGRTSARGGAPRGRERPQELKMLRNAPICSRRHSPMGMRYRLESNTCAQQLSSHPKINRKTEQMSEKKGRPEGRPNPPTSSAACSSDKSWCSPSPHRS